MFLVDVSEYPSVLEHCWLGHTVGCLVSKKNSDYTAVYVTLVLAQFCYQQPAGVSACIFSHCIVTDFPRLHFQFLH